VLLIDTYNVLHVVGVLPPDIAGIDTEGLIGLLRRSRYRTTRTILVCDGRPAEGTPQGHFGPVHVRYSAPHSADDVIIRLIERSSAPKRLIVVSSDRMILRAGRRRRCALLTSGAFLAQLGEDHVVRSMARGSGRTPPDPAALVDELAEAPAFQPSGGAKNRRGLPPDLLDEARAMLEALDEEELDAELRARLRASEGGDACEPEAASAGQDDATSASSSSRETEGPASPDSAESDDGSARPPSPAPPSGSQLRSVLPESLIAEAQNVLRELEQKPSEQDSPEPGSAETAPGDQPGRASRPSKATTSEAVDASREEPQAPGSSPSREEGAMLPDDVIREAEALLRSFEAEEGSSR
jgi:hypothetical protein